MEYVSCVMYFVLHTCRGCYVQLMFLEIAEGIWGLSLLSLMWREKIQLCLETTSGTWFWL